MIHAPKSPRSVTIDAPASKPPVFRKLTVGSATDPLEHEADRVADAVMRAGEGPAGGGHTARQPCAACSGADETRTSDAAPVEEDVTRSEPARSHGAVGFDFGRLLIHTAEPAVARAKPSGEDTTKGPCSGCEEPERTRTSEAAPAAEDEDVTLVRREPTGAGALASGAVLDGTDVAAEVHAVRASGGEALPPAVRRQMEGGFGFDFGGVRVHAGERAATTAASLSARAYTIGSDIVFGRGQYQPGSADGQRLLAHELAHVVQQGRAAPSYGRAQRAPARSPWAARDAAATLRRTPEPMVQRASCEVASGPTYAPTGAHDASGAGRHFAFTLASTFKNVSARSVEPRCCEVRQHVKWENDAVRPNHAGFQPAASYKPDTWYEDRDSSDKRYGHRAGTYSDPGNGDQYLNASGTRDQANGHIYSGSDDPAKRGTAVGWWKFKLSVVDTCNANAQIGSTSNLQINWK